jgi:hypothetical protein
MCISALAPPHGRQSGSALLIILAMIMLAFTAILAGVLPALTSNTRNTSSNAAVLAQAKAALIAYAVSQGTNVVCSVASTNCPRPGDLPCPDMTPDGNPNNGITGGNCGAQDGSTQQINRLGRLPWQTLGLPDLRDASGNRLWYAVSNNYKRSTRFPVLNSDTGLGTITVRKPNGNIQYNGFSPSATPNGGVVAVIIAPGAPLTRQGSAQQQDRTGNPAASAYLDIAFGEDNGDFIDPPTSAIPNNGFIQGPVVDAQGNTIVNDQLLVITYDDIMPLIEKRVANEALNELIVYQKANGVFPQPADFTDVSCIPQTPQPLQAVTCNSGASTVNCGRIPANPTPGYANQFLKGLVGGANDWFQRNGWRELVFYALAPNLLPGSTSCGTTGTLSVTDFSSPPAPQRNGQRAVVVVAGRALNGQNRANKTIVANYLERGSASQPWNGTSTGYSTISPTSASYNDIVVSTP